MTQPGTGGRWTLIVHIGLKHAHSAAIAAFLDKNEGVLADRGVEVVRIDADVSDSLARQDGSKAAVRVASAPWMLTLAVEEIRAAADMVAGAGGRLVVVVVLASPAEQALHQYVKRLRSGATGRLTRARLKQVNYLPALRRWESVLGQGDVRLLATDGRGPASALARSFAAELPVKLNGLWLPSARLDSRFTAATGEALRLVNVALESEPDQREAQELRRLAIRDLVAAGHGDDAPLGLPPDVALHLESVMRSEQGDLLDRLPSDEATRLSIPHRPRGAPATPQRLAELFAMLRRRPRLQVLLPADPAVLIDRGDALTRTRDAVVQSSASGDAQGTATASRQLRHLIEELPDFRIVGRETAPSIPRQLVQYWEPLPPPEYLREWIDSWNRLGMPGASRLVSFDEARQTMAAAAGGQGARAFDLTTHPAQRSDLFRYAHLVLHGGWYVDADHEALVTLSDVLTWPVRHVLVIRRGRKYPNGFIGAERGSAVMQEALAAACRNVVDSGGRMPTMQSTGPSMFTTVVKAYLDGPGASAVVLPGQAAFGDLIQRVHNDAEYKVVGHWRDA